MSTSADLASVRLTAGNLTRQREEGVSGAAIVGGAVTIVSLARAEDGQWILDAEGCREFKLAGRDQTSVQSFHAEMSAFISTVNISDLFLRVGPRSGPLTGIVESHVCEAALCLCPLRVHEVSAFSIAPRMRAANLEFGSQRQERAWQYALAAACLGSEQVARSRRAEHSRRAPMR
jgi:hypothetical protein